MTIFSFRYFLVASKWQYKIDFRQKKKYNKQFRADHDLYTFIYCMYLVYYYYCYFKAQQQQPLDIKFIILFYDVVVVYGIGWTMMNVKGLKLTTNHCTFQQTDEDNCKARP